MGSFAFSSGLESYLAHHKPSLSHPPHSTTTAISTTAGASFNDFLPLTISSLASTSLPYMLAAYRHPENIATLDNDLDASTPCTVARRASVAQGRALLGVWVRAFRGNYAPTDTLSDGSADIKGSCNDDNNNNSNGNSNSDEGSSARRATSALSTFSALLKTTPKHLNSTTKTSAVLGPNGHLAPLWGLVCASLSLPLSQTAYIFLFNHAKAVLSAAVRAGVMGPYQAQGVLASQALRERIEGCVRREWDVQVEEAGQVVPVMDLWVGRHELLYSRIFNS